MKGQPAREAVDAPSAAEAAKLARRAARRLAVLPLEERNRALEAGARALEQNRQAILEANAADLRAAEGLLRDGKITAALVARLALNEDAVLGMAEKVRSVARLPDPLGRTLARTELDRGLVLSKETCPLGVVAVVFESRPDVVPQVASLALKSGNAVLLKGGREAGSSNRVLGSLWQQALAACGLPEGSAAMLATRSDVMELLGLERDVDLLIPRGGKEFVAAVSRRSRIPVLGHGEGVCHVYVHEKADFEKARRIVLDAKVDYPAACNAAETLLVDAAAAGRFLPEMVRALGEAGVEVRGCERTLALVGPEAARAAGPADWATEYGDLILAVRVVDDLDQAIAHIHEYGSGHTEAILTEDAAAAERFLEEVDAAGVYHNASTRFADGYRYGLGAEVGISNGKLHARGPMGLEGLTTYKYKLRGSGQTAAEYRHGKRFTHRPL